MTENQEKTISLPKTIVANSRTVNQILTLKEIEPQFQNHIVIINGNDRKKNIIGIADYLVSILKARNASFPQKTIDNKDFRPLLVKSGMLAEELIEIVKKNFSEGTSRYSPNSIRVYLSAHLGKNSVIGIQRNRIGKIRLVEDEDKNRTCCASRCKYFAIE